MNRERKRKLEARQRRIESLKNSTLSDIKDPLINNKEMLSSEDQTTKLGQERKKPGRPVTVKEQKNVND